MAVKFYHIQTYTCYCGETIDHFFKGTEKEMEQYAESCVEDDAMEWWDQQSEEDFYDEYDAYLAECGYNVWEVSEEEYEKYKEF